MRARSGLGFLAAAVLGGGCLQALGYEEPTLLEAGAGGSGGSGGASAAHCSNATKDGDETGVDCGGLCSPCKDGGGCKVGPDCQSLVCGGGTCLAPACDDKAKNGDETGTDCGGATCTKCGPDQGCASGGDCVSGTCTAMQCASTCDDGLKGGGESDVDCGGPCAGCAIGKPCAANADCESGVCESKACVDYLVWAKRFGGVSGTDDTSVVGLGIDGTGNAVLGYALRGNANLGGGVLTSAGFSDVAFARYDLLGKHLWSQRFGDADDQNTRSFSVASDGTFHAAGVFASTLDFGGGNTINSASYNNYFLAELGASNVSAWARRFGGAADVTFGQLLLAESPFGGVVFAGCTNGGTVNLGGNPPMIAQSSSDIFVALFLSGSVFWGHVFSSSFVSEINGLAVDASDNTIISGTFTGNASFGGATFSANSNEPFLAKLNSKGAPLWSMHFKDATSANVRGVAVDPSGNIILFGLFYGSLDFGAGLLTSPSTSVFLLKTDPSGTMLWSKSFPTSGNQSIHVTTDAAGNLLMTGQGVTDFGGGPISTGVYIAKLDPSGAHVWSKQFGAGHDEGVAIAAYDTKNILVTGRLQGTIDFGGGPLSSVGMNDVFLAKLRLP